MAVTIRPPFSVSLAASAAMSTGRSKISRREHAETKNFSQLSSVIEPCLMPPTVVTENLWREVQLMGKIIQQILRNRGIDAQTEAGIAQQTKLLERTPAGSSRHV